MRRVTPVLVLLVFSLALLAYPTSDVAIAVTGSGTISVTVPATVSIHMVNSAERVKVIVKFALKGTSIRPKSITPPALLSAP